MRRLVTATFALTLMAGLVLPVFAGQAQPDPLGAIAEFFNTKAGKELAAEFTVGGENSRIVDGTGDFGHSTGESPGFTDPIIDIDHAWTANFGDGSAGFFGPTDQNTYWNPDGPPLDFTLPSGRKIYTLRGWDPHDGSQYDNGAVLFGMFLGDTPPIQPETGRCEYLVWLKRASISLSWENHSAFPDDPAGGTDLAIGIGLNAEGEGDSGTFALELDSGGSHFNNAPQHDIRAVITNRYVGIFAPLDLVRDLLAVNFYAFCTTDTFDYSPEVSGADQTGLKNLTSSEFGQVVYTIAPEPTTSTSTTTSTTLGASDDDEPDDSTAGGQEPEGGSATPVVVTVIGLGLAGAGYYFFSRTRTRPRRGGGTSAPGGGVTSTPREHHDQCDWALYFNDGGTRTLIRPAQGHECCVYDVEVLTTVDDVTVARGFRQDDDNPHGEDISPDERTRLMDDDWYLYGTNAGAYAATRTGPAGSQDWMHGLGDPKFGAGWKSTDEGEQHLQEKPLEERVDNGISWRIKAETVINAELTAGCPDYENTYELGAAGGVHMWATAECTNAEPGKECPVELTASGFVDASISGDINVDIRMKALTYPDELEAKAPNAPDGPVGGIDTHDHASRPRTDWEQADAKSGGATVNLDSTSLILNTQVEIDSGQIVPMEVWDTTERVTAEVGGEVDHTADISGHMTTECAGACKDHPDHGQCLCRPEFKVSIVGDQGTLEVDGETYDIEADPGGPFAPPTNEWKLA